MSFYIRYKEDEKMTEEINPECLELFISGDEHFLDEDYDLAIVDYISILKIDANCLEARLSLAQAYRCIEDWEKTIAEWETLLQINPEFALKQPEIAEWYACPKSPLELEYPDDGSFPF